MEEVTNLIPADCNILTTSVVLVYLPADSLISVTQITKGGLDSLLNQAYK